MNRNIRKILAGVVGLPVAAMIGGCSAESLFDGDGVGTVHLRTVVNTITTRADETSDSDQALRDNCVVYISDEKGLVYQERGLDKVPSAISLKTGHYVAEAWSGDSVTASFDKMFFRGYQPFDVTKGSESNVVVNCQIRNVVVSVNTATIDANLISDYTIKVNNKRGDLTFDKNNAGSSRGYFMMPNGDTKLNYTINVTRKDGETFDVAGEIANVESAHHYILNFTYDNVTGAGTGNGYVLFDIEIKDENLTSGNVLVPSAPTVTGVEFDFEKQLVYVNDEDIPEELVCQICGFGNGMKELKIGAGSDFTFGPSASSYQTALLTNKDVNLIADGNNTAVENYQHAGIGVEKPSFNSVTGVSTAFLKFSKDFLRNLAVRDYEHLIYIVATDADGRTCRRPLRLARSANAIQYEDPIVLQPVDTESNPMNVTGSTATITFNLSDDYDGTPGVEYRKQGATEWTFQAANVAAQSPALTRAGGAHTITLTGLETGTTYEYRACCGDFHSENVMTITTEEKFIIPYADMETWNGFTIDGQKNCTLPGTSVDEFWGNGNPGAAKAGAVLTQQSTDMYKSPSSSAKLRSQKATVFGIGKFAAGNLFAGEYTKTDGTNGVLKFGRPYNGTHPSALKVWVNYRPGIVEVDNVDDVKEYIQKGDTDMAQIYWALTTAPIDILTKPASRKLFNPDDAEVLAYGEYTFTGNYGPDGQLQELTIPIEYKPKASERGNKPTHLVIVCSASKYGDYFIGGEGSTLYLDDFELVY